ncbi:hypothetical protein ACWDSL_31375 [Streptomyces sp. NPDC000941]
MLIAGPRVRVFAGAGLLVTAAMLATAYQSSYDASGQSGGSSAFAKAAAAAGKDTGSGSSATKSFTAQDEGTQDGVGAATGNGERGKVGQKWRADDIPWSTRAEPQTGGYALITAKAKSGITCVLPAELPTVAFGSDGTEAFDGGQHLTLQQRR